MPLVSHTTIAQQAVALNGWWAVGILDLTNTVISLTQCIYLSLAPCAQSLASQICVEDLLIPLSRVSSLLRADSWHIMRLFFPIECCAGFLFLKALAVV